MGVVVTLILTSCSGTDYLSVIPQGSQAVISFDQSDVITMRTTPKVAHCLKDVLTGEIQYLDPELHLTSGGGKIIPVADVQVKLDS